MKKLIKPFIIFVLVLCAGIVILNQYKEEFSFYNPTVGVKVVIMLQNPDTGEYELDSQRQIRIEKDKPYTYSPATMQNYKVNQEMSSLTCESVTKQTEFKVYYECETCTVKFVSDRGVLTEGSAELVVRKGQVLTNLARFSCEGYEQTGYDKQVDKVYEDTIFNAVWALKEYNLYLYVTPGSFIDESGYQKSQQNANCYVKTFNFMQSFTLPELSLTSTEQIFLGWYDEVNGDGEQRFEVEEGTLSDLHFYAHYDVKTYELNFILNGENYTTVIAPAGEKIYSAGILASEQKAGMGLNWYTDESYQTLYSFDVMPQGGAVVYGKWENDVGVGFLDWEAEGQTIDSFEELTKLIDYTRFYNLTDTEVRYEVTYCSPAQFESDVKIAINSKGFSTSGVTTGVSLITEGDKLYISVFMERENAYEYEDLFTTQENLTDIYEYIGYAQEGRENNGEFYIDGLTNSYEAETTLQLQYVVERGYKPVCKPYSPASKAYARAREILNQIIGESYNDYQKVQAIYEWLVTSVQYDFNALSYDGEWYECDAYYMEGVFNNQKSVCGGIAKALSLMCNIEGIPCVEVTGNNHAWCKVKVNNAWYVVDATHGRVHLSGSEMAMLSHSDFLISDEDKALKGYSSNDHANIKATYNYDFFANKYYTFNGETYDYVIENIDEFANLLMYLNSNIKNLSYKTIDFSYQITDMPIMDAYANACQKLMLNGIKFNYQVQAIGGDVGEYAHILFS